MTPDVLRRQAQCCGASGRYSNFRARQFCNVTSGASDAQDAMRRELGFFLMGVRVLITGEVMITTILDFLFTLWGSHEGLCTQVVQLLSHSHLLITDHSSQSLRYNPSPAAFRVTAVGD